MLGVREQRQLGGVRARLDDGLLANRGNADSADYRLILP